MVSRLCRQRSEQATRQNSAICLESQAAHVCIRYNIGIRFYRALCIVFPDKWRTVGQDDTPYEACGYYLAVRLHGHCTQGGIESCRCGFWIEGGVQSAVAVQSP